MFDFNAEIGTMRLSGEIGSYFDGGVGADAILSALDKMGGQDLTVSLMSDGGDVFEGLSIYNALNHYPGKVSIVVDSLAASIASVIAMAGDTVSIHQGSMLMIHNPWTVAAGDAAEFRGVAEILDKIGGEIAGIYSARSGKKVDHFMDLMQADHYYTAEEAVEEGLADAVIKPPKKTKNQLLEKPVATAASFARRGLAERQLKLQRRAG